MKVWAYIHPELNILCCALLKESIPEGVIAVEFEIDNPSQIDDIIFDGTQIRFKTLEEKLQEKKAELQALRRQKVADLLVQTDYVITKISDLKTQLELGIITPSVYDAETQKYRFILQRRRNIRQWNAYIESRIERATTLEELMRIKADIDEYQGEDVSPFGIVKESGD
jgi:uncharacterized membrane protein YcgQ (UPF0703/DUF1980 family)